MPRGRRGIVGGLLYHVLNRGNERQRIFHKPGDYRAFVELLLEGKQHASVELLAYCIMPNHWHAAVIPKGDHDLAHYCGWVTNTHVKRYRQHYQTIGNGHVYQGRYKSFPVEDDFHARVMLRYVEANALRAGLASRAELWPWCSAASLASPPGLLSPWPIDRPNDWLEMVNTAQPQDEVKELRQSLQRDYPYGSEVWVKSTAARLGLTLRPRGRPRKSKFITNTGNAT